MEIASRSKRRQAIIPLLKDPSPEVRQAAAQALETLEAAGSLEEVFERLKRGDRATKIRAIYALGRIGGQQVLPILLYCAGRSEEDIRYAAIKVLGELARPEALALLVEKLQDPSPEVRAVTIEALAQYRDASLVPSLIPFLEENDGMLDAEAALAQYRDASLVPSLIPFLEENDGMLDAEAALALGRIGNASLAEPLMKLLSSPHERTRAAAATALALLP